MLNTLSVYWRYFSTKILARLRYNHAFVCHRGVWALAEKPTWNRVGIIGLSLGIMGGTFAATLIRLAQEAGITSVALASGRLLFACVVLSPLAVRHGQAQIQALSRRSWLLILIAGVTLGFHFATFVSALAYTSVLQTLVFSATTPFFAAFIAYFTINEQVRRGVWFGIVLALAGTVMIAVGSDSGVPPTRSAPLLGSTLALGSAFLMAAYLTLGRQVRGELNTVTYSTLVFGVGGVFLAAVMLPILGESLFGHSPAAYFWLIMTALVAQVGGHSGWNMALGGFPATIVSMGLLLVPVTGTIFALIVLSEIPGIWALIGSAVIIAGIGTAVATRPS